MTIETTAIKAVALGNGATTVWPYTFLIPTLSDVIVTLVDVASGNETSLTPASFTISGLNSPVGGTVTYPLSGSPLTSATKIVIERALPLTQETDLLNQGGVYPQAIEDALDYLTMVTQQLQDQINRSIVFSIADTVETTMPVASARANKYLAFNSSGEPIAASVLTPGTTVSAAMIPVVTAPTTAAALIALGIPGSLLDALIPAGTVWDYAGTTAPTGFLLAFGQACTPTYPTLRALLVAAGSPYGTNGVDPLLPDLRSRSITGKSNMGGVDNGLWSGGTVLGAVVGTQTITLTLAQIPTGIISSNIAAIPLSVTSVNNDIVRDPGGIISSNAGGGANHQLTVNSVNQAQISTGSLAIGAIAVNSTNTLNQSHENRHPSIILNKIVKAH